MVALRTLLPVLTLTATQACFRGPPADAEARAAPRELALRDPDGAAFALSEAPRDLALYVGFGDTPPAHAELNLLLVRGILSPTFVSQLSAARLRSVVMARMVPLALTRLGDQLEARPAQPLEPGARYSLLWAVPEAPASFTLAVSSSPALGARLVETWPGSGEAAVPQDLSRALLRFDGQLNGDPAAHITLRDRSGTAIEAAVEVAACATLGLPAGDCVWVVPHAPLTPGARYDLTIDGGLQTLTGAALASSSVSFTIAQHEDREPPTFVAGTCASDESPIGALCLRAQETTFSVRGTVDEAAWLSIAVDTDGNAQVATLSYANSFELAQVPAPGAATVVLQARDMAGNLREQVLPVATAPDLPALSIEEVRADPLGKEPAQEYVELLNYGRESISLMGFKLSKDPSEAGRALLGALALAPGERALAVGPDFDPRDLSDGALPSGLKIVRLEGSLGLANAGANLFLRDGRGRRVSAATALASLIEGQCSARSASDRRSGAPAAFELDPDGSCTPGAPTFDQP